MERDFEKFLKREVEITIPNWEEEKGFYESLKEDIDSKIKSVFMNDDGYTWLSLKIDEYGKKVKEKIPNYGERFQYLAYNILYGSTVNESSGNIKYIDFADDDYSVKFFYEGLLKELDEKDLDALKEVVREYLKKHSLK